MKKWIAMTLGLLLVAGLTGCGAANTSQSGQTSQSQPSSAVESISSGEASQSGETSQPPEETQPSFDSVEISLDDKKLDEVYSEDGSTLLLSVTYVQPEITNVDAADTLGAIQDDLDSEVAAFLADEARQQETAQGELDFTQETPDSYDFVAYSMDLSFRVERNDSEVLSLVADYVSYAGGAHGSDYRFCLNYNVETGERIVLSDLGADFVQSARDSVLAQAGEMTADKVAGTDQPAVFDEYADSIDAVVSDATFYFTDDAVVFLSGEYVMQSYAAGIIEFSVPYDDVLGQLSEPYLPNPYR